MTRVQRLGGPTGQRVTVVAGILGLVQDEEVVRDAFRDDPPSTLLLGIPYEDLDSVRATSGREADAEFESGDLDDQYMERLAKFGAVQSPPPDLYAAYQMADAAQVPIEAIDLGDEAYTEAFTKNVGMFEVLRSNRNQKRLPDRAVSAGTAEEFAVAWDAALYPTKGLRRVQGLREAWMAEKIHMTPPKATALALLPLPRAAGVVERLQRVGWRVLI